MLSNADCLSARDAALKLFDDIASPEKLPNLVNLATLLAFIAATYEEFTE